MIEAPEPLDIIWENFHHSDGYRTLRRFVGFLVTLILLLICSSLVYWLIKFQTDSMKEFKANHQGGIDPTENEGNQLSLLVEEQMPSVIVSFCLVCINSIVIEILFR